MTLSRIRGIFGALLGLVLWSVPTLGQAEGVPPSTNVDVEQRLLALEDELAATKAELAAVKAPPVGQGDAVAIDSFLNGVEFGGHVTASYIYNFNNPGPGASGNGGFSAQPLCQFNCEHNTFKLDAAKFEVGKPTNGPGTAGFQLDLLYGQNADISRFLSPTAGGAGVFGDDDFSLFVQQAYVEYDWNGTSVKFGNFETLLGWELIDSHKNNNVTHGILFTWTIPLYHTGVMLGGSLTEEINWNLGFVNGFNNTVETQDQKGVLGLLSYESGGLFTSVSSYYGFDNATGSGMQPSSSDSQWIIDYVASYQANDKLSFWFNGDFGIGEDQELVGASPEDAEWWGVAIGTRYDLTESTYASLRYEYFSDDDNVRGITGASDDFEASSITGTVGHKLTDNLLVRAELRYDEADDDGGGNIFANDNTVGTLADDDTLFGLVEVSYQFD